MASEEQGIKEPAKNDVLSGRGNSVNFHPGNEYFRSLVKKYRVEYVACPKPLKGHFSKLIVDKILSLDPPGRFLKQDPKTKLWSEIGYKKSLDKTRQALREGAPELLKEMNIEPEKTSIPTSESPPPLQVPVEVKQPTIPSLLANPNEAKHITIKDMENILETLQKNNAAAHPYLDDLETHSISSDIFSEGSLHGMEDEKLNTVHHSARTIVSQAPGKRPSINLESSAPKGVSWSVSMDKLDDKSLDELLITVRNQLSTSDLDLNGTLSLDQIITPEKLDTIPLEQRSELRIALSQFLLCTSDEQVAKPAPAPLIDTNDQQPEFDLSQYAHKTTGPRSDLNCSELSMSLNSLGTFDPTTLYPYKKEEKKNNRSRPRLDDYNNSLFDSMQMSLASWQMDNAD